MTDQTVGFVGGGRVARIILGGWRRTGTPLPAVVVSDADAAVLERLHAEFPAITCTADNRVAGAQPVVLFGMHPPAFPAVLEEIKASLRGDAVLVSLAPKWSISRICGALGGFDRIVRVIPNAPSLVNAGYNPVAFSDRLSAVERSLVLSLLSPLGACPEVPEATLEAYAIVSAMGPTYLWPQLYQLVELGREFGMSDAAAREATVGMMHGALKTMTESGLSADGVMDLIPVKPMAAFEPEFRKAYADTLGALHRKLVP